MSNNNSQRAKIALSILGPSEKVLPLGRTFLITRFLVLLAFRTTLFNVGKTAGESEEELSSRRRELAVWVRQSLTLLGPTFIKLGQLFSTRSDILPKEFIEELAKLQDKVPPFDFESAAKIIEEDFGKPLGELFIAFDPEPLASASLGQIHRAKVRSGEGIFDVVVKVQRPRVREIIRVDLMIIKHVVNQLRLNPRLTNGNDVLGTFDEMATILWRELDYFNEGKNANRLRRAFTDPEWSWVKIPRVFWATTSSRVLTLEYLPGLKVNDLAGLEKWSIDRELVARRLILCFLKQVSEDGFFHADPHPGNVAVAARGEIILYDFGMMGALSLEMRSKLFKLAKCIIKRDGLGATELLVGLGMLESKGSRSEIRDEIQAFLDTLSRSPGDLDSLATLAEDLMEVASSHSVRFPPELTFVGRSTALVEALAKELNPEIDLGQECQLYLRTLSKGKKVLLFDPQDEAFHLTKTVERVGSQMTKVLSEWENGEFRIEAKATDTDRQIRKLRPGLRSITFAVLFSGLLVSGTIFVVEGHTWIALLETLPGLFCLEAVYLSLQKLD